MSLLNKKWIIQNDRCDMKLLDALLANRQIMGNEDRRLFLEGDLNLVHDPMLLKDMGKACERIKKAVERGEKIMVFGDYDIDGITATAIVYDFLKKVGANAEYKLPNREDDGYGLKDYFIKQFKKSGINLVIAVDCGTSNVKEIELARSLAMDVLVLDHHSIPNVLPPAYALVNPLQKDCNYPNKNLCGSSLAYKLVMALSQEFFSECERKEYLMRQLSLVTLGIIGDCMPLLGENRVLTKYGLKSVRDGHNPGLLALLEVAGLDVTKVTSFTIGFQLGPRLNAAGRMDRPDHALELILGNLDKACVLEQLNKLRKETVKGYVEEAEKMVRMQKTIQPLIIAYDTKWKAGLLGLIAAHLSETFNRPSIAMQEKNDEFVGSCRSFGDFDITEFLRESAGGLFSAIGGHKMAGGFTLPKKNFGKLIKAIEAAAKKQIKTDSFASILPIDCEVNPDELTLETCNKLNKLQPFGPGNPEPTLVIRNTRILDIRPVGKNGEHLQLPIEYAGRVHQGIAFRLGKYADKIDIRQRYDIVFNIEINEWNNERKLQLKVVDLKPFNQK